MRAEHALDGLGDASGMFWDGAKSPALYLKHRSVLSHLRHRLDFVPVDMSSIESGCAALLQEQ